MTGYITLALPLTIIVSGCTERKPPFSYEQFLVAKSQCRAIDAYIIATAPNTIGFHGGSDNQVSQAKCLKKKLARTDVETVIVRSQLYERP